MAAIDAVLVDASPTSKAAFRAYLAPREVVQAAGCVLVDGGLSSGLSLPRDDAQYVFVAPSTGTAGQRHGLVLGVQDNSDDEIAYTGYHKDSLGAYRQTSSYFSAFRDHIDTAASFVSYMGFHGESGAYGDNTPLILYTNNSVEVCAGATSGTPFDLGLTDPGVFHNFLISYLQGAVVCGEHSQSVDTGFILQTNGYAHFGNVHATTKVSTTGVTVGYSVGSGYGFIQSYDLGTSTFKPLVISGSTVTVASSGQSLGFYGATPVAKQTGVAVNAAAIHAALVSLGLIAA